MSNNNISFKLVIANQIIRVPKTANNYDELLEILRSSQNIKDKLPKLFEIKYTDSDDDLITI